MGLMDENHKGFGNPGQGQPFCKRARKEKFEAVAG